MENSFLVIFGKIPCNRVFDQILKNLPKKAEHYAKMGNPEGKY